MVLPMLNHQTTHATSVIAPRHLVTIKRQDELLRATFTGPTISEEEARIIDDDLTAAIRLAGRSVKTVVLDLSEVMSLSSIGLGMCIDVRNNAEQQGMKTILIGLNRELRDLFSVMRINRLFMHAHDEDELRKLRKQK